MASTDDILEKITNVQTLYSDELMKKKNVVGVGVGLRKQGDKFTQDPALVVLVEKKQPLDELDDSDRIPSELDGVVVDVQVVGQISAQD